MMKFQDVCFAYDENPVLRNINLMINENKTYVLEGPNGCGKSTLLKIMNGLLFVSSGKYLFNGNLITENKMKDVRFSKHFHKKIGFVFQNPDVQLFCSSVEDEIAFGPQQMGLSAEEVLKRVNDCLKLFDIQKLRERAPYHLSTGEKKKVAIACTLAVNPDVLVLDEPLSGLDEKTQIWIEKFLIELKGAGHTMVIATHNREFAENVADYIVFMNENHEIQEIKHLTIDE